MFGFDKINLNGRIQKTPVDTNFASMPLNKIDSLEQSSNVDFKGVISGLANNLNSSLEEPETLIKRSMSGDTSVDIHDIMTAMAKAEINVSVATQFTSKVIQAYDKIMQISV